VSGFRGIAITSQESFLKKMRDRYQMLEKTAKNRLKIDLKGTGDLP